MTAPKIQPSGATATILDSGAWRASARIRSTRTVYGLAADLDDALDAAGLVDQERAPVLEAVTAGDEVGQRLRPALRERGKVDDRGLEGVPAGVHRAHRDLVAQNHI